MIIISYFVAEICYHTKVTQILFATTSVKSGCENILQSYTENTDFHILVAYVHCACLTTRWKYDVIYLTSLALDIISYCVAMRKGYATGNNGKELYWILIKLLTEWVKSTK